jgi:ribosomal protein S20
MKSALTTIVPAVDSALAALDSAAQSVVKSALSRAMDRDHKALVKEIKAAL